MKGLVLAVLANAFYLVLISLVFRRLPIRGRAGLMLGTFLATLPLYGLAYALTPDPLFGWLPAPDNVPAWLDVAFGVFVYAAGFFGGALQLYNLGGRGMSLRILIDIEQSSLPGATFDDVIAGYSAGKGMRWMYDKRIEGLLEQKLVDVDGDLARVSAKGLRTAKVFGALQDYMRLVPPRIIREDLKPC